MNTKKKKPSKRSLEQIRRNNAAALAHVDTGPKIVLKEIVPTLKRVCHIY